MRSPLTRSQEEHIAKNGSIEVMLMIVNGETAKALSEELLSLYNKLEKTVEIVARTESEEVLQAYRVALTSVLSTMIFGVMEPVYKQHKHLTPPDWD